MLSLYINLSPTANIGIMDESVNFPSPVYRSPICRPLDFANGLTFNTFHLFYLRLNPESPPMIHYIQQHWIFLINKFFPDEIGQGLKFQAFDNAGIVQSSSIDEHHDLSIPEESQAKNRKRQQEYHKIKDQSREHMRITQAVSDSEDAQQSGRNPSSNQAPEVVKFQVEGQLEETKSDDILGIHDIELSSSSGVIPHSWRRTMGGMPGSGIDPCSLTAAELEAAITELLEVARAEAKGSRPKRRRLAA